MRGILVANWKNHPASKEEASRILQGLMRQSTLYKRHSTFIAPPTVYFESVSAKARRLGGLASQDIFPLKVGSHTGNITPDILKSFGVKLSIIGHSEKRKLGESSADVAQKVRMALDSGINPLVCVGEEVHDSEGKYFEFLSEEIRNSLATLKKNEVSKLVIAYEPIWAIGKKAKDAMESAELSQMVVFIRKNLSEMFGQKVALRVPILYGGSVEATNAFELAKTGVSGFLVGHASLVPKDFKIIAESLLEVR